MSQKSSILFPMLFVLLFLSLSGNALADYLEQAKQALAEGNIPYSIELLHKSADLEGSTVAMGQLGMLYLDGSVVEKDVKIGLEYFHRAIDAGSVDALSMLGIYYSEGRGVTKDTDMAFRLWKRAYELGSSGAAYNISSLFNPDLNLGRSDSMRQQEWLVKAAEAGSLEGQYMLSFEMLGSKWKLTDLNHQQKIEAAYKWARLAKARGHGEAADLALYMEKQYGLPDRVIREAEAFVAQRR